MFTRLVREIKNKGGNVVREAGPMMGSKLLLAFIEDPNGYKIELIQKACSNYSKKSLTVSSQVLDLGLCLSLSA